MGAHAQAEFLTPFPQMVVRNGGRQFPLDLPAVSFAQLADEEARPPDQGRGPCAIPDTFIGRL